MRIVTYRHQGVETFGVVTAGGVVNASRRLGGRCGGLREVLAADALDEVRRAVSGQAPDAKLDDVEYLPPIHDPGKGDEVEVDISGVGVLRNPIMEE
jgi:hypothetical protein